MGSVAANGESAHAATIMALLKKPEDKVFGSPAFLRLREPALRKRAAFDLKCSETDLAVADLGGHPPWRHRLRLAGDLRLHA